MFGRRGGAAVVRDFPDGPASEEDGVSHPRARPSVPRPARPTMNADLDEPPRPDGDVSPEGGAAEADDMDQDGALGPDRGPEPPPFVVVGLGASAGGLEALEAFFAGLPKTDGAAFVVVVHLAPDQESRMAEVLDRSVPIPVTQVTDRVRVEAGHVYVIPPDRNLVMEDGHLRLTPLESERQHRRPVDHFFRTLAEAWGERAVGVVLSGTGQNGTVGVRRIRELGGLILAQDPDDAAFGEMPRSALASGVVDHVAPAGELGREAIDYADRLRETRVPDGETAEVPADDVRTVQRILALLTSRTGHDFAHYKRSTVLRRLARRVHVVGAEGLQGYLDHLRRQPAEAEMLLDDLLISVTNFFRDPEAFGVLEGRVVPRLFEGKRAGDEVRVWVAGCATGEEAYSVAVLLLEHAATLADAPDVQVFATDLSERAVRTARAGVYPASVEADVSPERLRRFFRRVPGGYQVTPGLREAVLFAPHSLLKDPPFARLDLVTCRNLLIYLQRDLQRRVLELFHYVLRPGGALFLGTSETAEAGGRLFQTEDKAARVYRRRDAEAVLPDLPRVPRAQTRIRPAPVEPEAPAPPAEPRSYAELHRAARAAAAPPGVLVTAERELAHVSEGAAPFLRLGEGEPSQSLLRLVLPPLRPAVQTALYQAQQTGAAATSVAVRVEVGGEERAVTVRAVPAGGDLFAVAFEAAAPPAPPAPHGGEADALSTKLQETQEQLQLSIEEFETSREELKAQNEELQSVNEELRSTAEELETAKEEAQSMAEELQTSNDELKAKVDELAQTSGDLENLVVSTEIATLFLDRRLRIKWFTPHVRRHFRIRDADVGRPLSDLAPRFGSADLAADAEAVLDRLQVTEREVRGEDGRWYLVHVRPYRTVGDRIDGVVVTFVDITERREVEEERRRSGEELQALVEASAQIVWTADAEGRIVEDSPSWRAFTGQTYDEWKGEGGFDVVHPDDRDGAHAAYGAAVEAGEPFEHDLRLWHAPTGAWRWTHVRAAPLYDDAGAVRGWVGMNADVTEQRAAEAARQAGAERAAFRVALADALRPARDPVAVEHAAARVLGEHLGASRVHAAEAAADGATATVRTDYHDGVPSVVGAYDLDAYGPAAMDEVRAGRTLVVGDVATDPRLGGAAREATLALDVGAYLLVPVARDGRGPGLLAVHAAGPRAWTAAEVALVEEAAERVWEAVGRAEAEAALRASEKRFRQAVDAADLGTWTFDPATGLSHFDARMQEIFGLDTATPSPDEVDALVHPDDRAAFAAARAAALAPGGAGAFSETHRVVRPDGEVRWVQGQARVLFEGEGEGRRPARAVGVVVDVTDRRLAEEALRASEERFRRTAETVPDILFTADARGRVDYVNPRFAEVTGHERAVAIGTEMWQSLIHPDDRSEATSVFEGRGGAGPREVRYRLQTASGAYRWFLTRVLPVRDVGGGVVAWFGASTDIDRIVRAEEEVQALNATLERRVRERTALARRLLAQLTVAEEAERKRIAGVLHDDLQQRLYGLSMALTLLREPVGAAGDPELLARAEGVLAEAMTLTRTLATEMSPAVLDAADLDELFEWVAEHVHGQYGLPVGVAVEPGCRIDDHAARVAVYQTVREALFNVVKHARADGARLSARTEGGAVVVRVEDDGVGFAAPPPDGAGDGAAAGDLAGEGTGLGLPSVASRIDLVGGRLEVESAPGEGTRLTVTVPLGAGASGDA